jgi:hypothetical protein
LQLRSGGAKATVEDYQLLGLEIDHRVRFAMIVGEFDQRGLLGAGRQVLDHRPHFATGQPVLSNVEKERYWSQQWG